MNALNMLVSLLLLTSLAHAKTHPQSTFEANRSGVCIQCTENLDRTVSQVRDLRNTVTNNATVEDLASVNERMNFADKCESFVGEEGLGKWGTTIVNELHRNRYQALYEGTPDLRAVCPAYNKLNDNGKELVWVMILNAMVHLESSCDKTETAKGPNGSLVGLLQLHRNKEEVYAKGCQRGDGQNTSRTFACGLSMLNRQLENDEALFSRKSYWDVLRPQARSKKFKKVQLALRKLAICK